MPEVVLRKDDVLPYIVDVPVGSYVSPDLRDAGWVIDTDTTPEEARAEIAAGLEAAVVEAQDAAEDFVPQFPPVDNDEPPTPAPAATQPAPSPTPSPSPEPVDTTKEN